MVKGNLVLTRRIDIPVTSALKNFVFEVLQIIHNFFMVTLGTVAFQADLNEYTSIPEGTLVISC